MPKSGWEGKLERVLSRRADARGFSPEHKRAYVYGTLENIKKARKQRDREAKK